MKAVAFEKAFELLPKERVVLKETCRFEGDMSFLKRRVIFKETCHF